MQWQRSACTAVMLVAGAVGQPPAAAGSFRFATFNLALNRPGPGDLARELAGGASAQARALAEIIQRVRPHVLLLCELDHDPEQAGLRSFCREYLEVAQGRGEPIEFPYRFVAPVNTGLPTGEDLDHDGSTDGPGDAFGYGAFPGQYGMALLSRLPIDEAGARTFRLLRWQDLPGALLPDDRRTPAAADYYDPAALRVLRLSSKSHWDVPVRCGAAVVHVLACHPTPPVFDGPEDRNGCRNHDEIRLWADYVDPARSGYIRDDRGRRGGLAAGADFVVMGDLNADPADGDARPGAIGQLLDHPAFAAAAAPSSAGGADAAARQGGVNTGHRGDPAADTADFEDQRTGNLRLDYVLPSAALEIGGSGVFWPVAADPDFARLIGADARPVSSDHRLVYCDLKVPQAAGPPPVGERFGAVDALRFLDGDRLPRAPLTLLRWWTDTCPHCAATLPALEKLRERFGARGLAIVAVYHPKPPRHVDDAQVRAAAEHLGFHGPLAVDPTWQKLLELQRRGVPNRATSVSVLVDGDGVVQWIHPGPRLHPSTEARFRVADADYAALTALLEQQLGG